ncbi:MAG: hypothetical protein JW782_06550 [Candidatus Saganbacteria bacterium]|nr:hypothetical protein [Candidatus Saganbacteria bacterium]
MVTAYEGKVVDTLKTNVDDANLEVLDVIIEAANECADLSEATDAVCDGDPHTTDEEGAIRLGGKEAMMGSVASVALIEFVKEGISTQASTISGVGIQPSKCQKVAQQKFSALG